jgi:hypothetical protein
VPISHALVIQGLRGGGAANVVKALNANSLELLVVEAFVQGGLFGMCEYNISMRHSKLLF